MKIVGVKCPLSNVSAILRQTDVSAAPKAIIDLIYEGAGLPSVPYLTVQYRILALVPSVPYGTGNVPFFKQ